MSVLPDVERELLRVARQPLAAAAAAAGRGASARRAASRLRRLGPSSVVVLAGLLAVVVGVVFVAALHRGRVGQGTGGGPGHSGPGEVQSSTNRRESGTFPGAPHSQPDRYGVATGACPVAPSNRYLPARSGCLTALRADLDGDGRADLVLLYSRLSREPAQRLGLPASFRNMFVAQRAIVRVVRARGGEATARIDGARASALIAAAHVGAGAGDELFLQISQISSGATAVAYGLHDGRLVPAGVTLGYGGDSATKAGFDCVTGTHPRLLQRRFALIGPTIDGWWRETDVTYAWHGPRLVRIARHSFRRRGLPSPADTGVGAGCR